MEAGLYDDARELAGRAEDPYTKVHILTSAAMVKY